MKYLYLLAFSLFTFGCGGADDSANTLVYIGTGEVQCEESGRSIEEMEQVLKNQGITIHSAACGDITEISIPSLCGLGTTGIYIFEINKDHLSLAEEYNFRSIDDTNYETSDCD